MSNIVEIWLQACLHWRCAFFQTLSWNDMIFVVDWDILFKLCGSANKWSKGFVFSGKIWWQLLSCNKACSKHHTRSTTTPKIIYAPTASCLYYALLLLGTKFNLELIYLNESSFHTSFKLAQWGNLSIPTHYGLKEFQKTLFLPPLLLRYIFYSSCLWKYSHIFQLIP